MIEIKPFSSEKQAETLNLSEEARLLSMQAVKD